MSDLVVVNDPRPAVRVIALSRPEKKTALTRAMYDALATALRAADSDRTIRVVCLTGSADAFTAGNDIADFRAGPPPISIERRWSRNWRGGWREHQMPS
jgi:enoyl-CoA hydratase/carnithine racemase